MCLKLRPRIVIGSASVRLVLQPQPEILAPGVTCGRPLHRPAAVEVTDNGRYLATDAEHTRGGRWPRHFLVRSRRTGLGRLGWHWRRGGARGRAWGRAA